jgi:hypothetical protein
MGYAEYINQIAFKILQPDVPVADFLKSNTWVKPYITSAKSTGELEVMNTEIPGADHERIRKLGSLLNIPRMSTFAIAAIINKAVALMPDDLSFVNVGVWNGFTLLSGMVNNPQKTCVGIDNFSQFGGPRQAFLERFNKQKSPQHSFYDMDYRDYFRQFHHGLIGAYLYDGEHSYANQYEGLQVAEPFFADGCLVFVDDTNWSEPKSATLDFTSQSANRYDILLDEVTCQNRHPTFWNGFMVLQCHRKSEA